jgi:DNA-binding NarL/FixJ family response regulator
MAARSRGFNSVPRRLGGAPSTRTIMIRTAAGGVENGAALPPRLQQTLVCVLQGQSEKEIAASLRLSRATVHQYITLLYRRFGVRSRAQLLGRLLQRLEKLPGGHLARASGVPLSPRLQQTLDCLLEGHSEKEAARRLQLSRATLHQYVSALYRRFGVASRGQLLGQILKRRSHGSDQLLQLLLGSSGVHGGI